MIEIGSFRIDPVGRTLSRNGNLVRVGNRAFDILVIIARADGRLVTKQKLLATVWPSTVVGENSLYVVLSGLRKILGSERDLIVNVRDLGYQLNTKKIDTVSELIDKQPINVRSLPRLECELLGRTEQIRSIRTMIRHSPVVTLVGAGGIGKTSLAIEMARKIEAQYSNIACFVDLAKLNPRVPILNAIAENLGLPATGSPFDVARVATALSRQCRLLLLDNAEHLIDEVAHTVEALLALDDSLRILVTSREPLRIRMETIFRVQPLDVPPPQSSDAQILQSSAVALFLKKAFSSISKPSIDSSTIQLVGEICRRLEGLPLAIEIAAARVPALGVAGIFRSLGDSTALLDGSDSTATPRHVTLRATFDWSFALLDTASQLIFRRIAIFSSGFSVDAMCAVVCDDSCTAMDAINGVTELVEKSLVSVEFVSSAAQYRLSESTRAYANERLHAEGEFDCIALRHSRYLSTASEILSNGELKCGGEPRELHNVTD
ncbi:putative ATPase/DNA-binding winged helix-turn-helix (wHTH) protein [Paraburkholderia sp. GAS199]|uniref:winged helix-turn-helix domain-containing protein n=1 Tax=Paraburkholderia sp. GAS199 TaxID=3035126 RepID=UPI003D194875